MQQYGKILSTQEYIGQINNLLDNVLLSSELMWHGHFASKLREFQNVFDVKIVAYVRRQDLTLMSRYNQQQKVTNEFYKDIFEFLPKVKVALDYESVLCRWSEQFGRENIIVRPYEKQQLYKENIFADFLRYSLGVELSNEYVLPKIASNPKLSRDALEFKNHANCLQLSQKENQGLVNALVGFSVANSKDSDRAFSEHDLLSPKERVEFLRQYQNINEEVARKYLGREDGRLFYDPIPDIDDPWKPYEGLTNDKINEISGFLKKTYPKVYDILYKKIISNLVSEDNDSSLASHVLMQGFIGRFKAKSRWPVFKAIGKRNGLGPKGIGFKKESERQVLSHDAKELIEKFKEMKLLLPHVAKLTDFEFDEFIKVWHDVVEKLKDVVYDPDNKRSRLEYEYGWGAQSIQYAIDCIPEFHRLLRRYYRRVDQLRMLDVGAGSGAGSNVFASLHSDRYVYSKIIIDAIDYTPIRKRWVQAVYPKVNYTVEDLYDLPDRKWDFVLCSAVIEHVPSPRQFIEQLVRVSKGFTLILAPYKEINRIPSHVNTIDETLFKNFKVESLSVFESMAWHPDVPGDKCILVSIDCRESIDLEKKSGNVNKVVSGSGKKNGMKPPWRKTIKNVYMTLRFSVCYRGLIKKLRIYYKKINPR